MNSLLSSSLEPSTVTQYQRVWANFQNFVTKTLGSQTTLPYSGKTVGLYVSHLHSIGLLPNTIRTHLSAISFFHKIHEFKDPTQSFLVTKLMVSIQKQVPTVDKRLPISKNLLLQLIAVLSNIVSKNFDVCLYSSMFSLAYFACLRIGELTVSQSRKNILCLHQITKVFRNNELCAIRVYFEQFKHSKSATPVLEIPKQSDASCPVLLLQRYISVRPKNLNDPLFLDQLGSPVSRQKFLAILHKCITHLSLDSKKYNTHSFRIGRCTDLVMLGFSEEQIRNIGRWKSDAYKRYIRPDVILCAI